MMFNNLDVIDTAKNTTIVEMFVTYSKMFNQDGWDGMKVIEKALYNLELNSTDTGIEIPHFIHKRLIEDYLFVNMYTKYKADL